LPQKAGSPALYTRLRKSAKYQAPTKNDQVNKTLFTFASYNAGPNRIARLRKKAAAEGLDPNKWFGNVKLEVAEDIGQETVTYVGNVYKYYIAYKMAAEREQERERAKAAVGGIDIHRSTLKYSVGVDNRRYHTQSRSSREASFGEFGGIGRGPSAATCPYSRQTGHVEAGTHFGG
jgi:hypothetical protein